MFGNLVLQPQKPSSFTDPWQYLHRIVMKRTRMAPYSGTPFNVHCWWSPQGPLEGSAYRVVPRGELSKSNSCQRISRTRAARLLFQQLSHSSPLFLKTLSIYLFLVVLGLHCCMWAFCSLSEQGLFSSCSAWALLCGGFSCCRARALGAQASIVVAHGL